MSVQIAFVTSEQWPELAPDDRLAVQELVLRGAVAVPAVWTRVHDWSRFDLVVLRSCWDYHHRIDEFRAWVEALEDAGVRMLNPAPTIRWNLDKRYLLDLADAGADVIDTVVPETGDRLSDILADRGWTRAVLKPRISADGHRTTVVAATEWESHQAELDELIAGPGALVQEYVEEIAHSGELSLVFIGQRFSHCVRKLPAAGEFRVQGRFGGRVEPFRPDADVVHQAASVLSAAQRSHSYARVDGCVVNGRLMLMELELMEPSLFLDCDDEAPARFANVVLAAGR